MFDVDDAFVMVRSHEVGPKSKCSCSFEHPRRPDAGTAVWRWRRSRPAMMVSLNINHTTNAGRRLCSEHDVDGNAEPVKLAYLNIENRLVLRPMRENMLIL